MRVVSRSRLHMALQWSSPIASINASCARRHFGSASSTNFRPFAGVIVAEGDFVIIHGRFSGNGRPRSWIAADVVRIADEVLAEHWDVLQDEASRAESLSGLPMFGDRFPD